MAIVAGQMNVDVAAVNGLMLFRSSSLAGLMEFTEPAATDGLMKVRGTATAGQMLLKTNQ